MAIRFVCEHCGQKLNVGSEKAGLRAKCPKCSRPVVVPAAASSPNPAAQAISSPPPPELTPAATRPPPPPGDSFPQTAATVVVDEPPPASDSSLDFFATPMQADRTAHRNESDTSSAYIYIDEDAAPREVIDRTKLAVSRQIIYLQGGLLAALTMLGFLLGYLVGGRGGGGGDGPQTAAIREPLPCVVSGRVTYTVDSGEKFPDDGAVIIVLPQGEKPGVDEKIAYQGIRPNDPPPVGDHDAISMIRLLGGSYGRADGNGEFRLRLPDTGKFHLLIVSRFGKRKPSDEFIKTDLAQMGRYFVGATDLVGDRRYRWRSEDVYKDKRLAIVLD